MIIVTKLRETLPDLCTMEIIGYLAAILIGVSLGLIGGGGSILTMPVLVYLFGIDPVLATSYSLFIVGTSSLVGAARNFKGGNVNVKVAMLFGLASIATVLITRKVLMPMVPDVLFTAGTMVVKKSMATMVLFAVLMVFASVSMIKGRKQVDAAPEMSGSKTMMRLLIQGGAIGLVTGVLGAGGGFLLIPALVLFLQLPMKQAVGTSLLIIAMNSLIGFAGDIGSVDIDVQLLLTVTAIAVAGIFVGVALSSKIEGGKLKKGFGWFVLVMAAYILLKEIYK